MIESSAHFYIQWQGAFPKSSLLDGKSLTLVYKVPVKASKTVNKQHSVTAEPVTIRLENIILLSEIIRQGFATALATIRSWSTNVAEPDCWLAGQNKK